MNNNTPPLPTDSTRPRPRRRGRRWRWAVRLVIGIPMLCVIALLVLMRSPAVGRMVGQAVTQLTGGRWRADRAFIALNGQLVIEGLSLRVPGIDGPGGEVLAAPRAIADIDWSGLPVLRWFGSGGAAGGGGGGGGGGGQELRVTAIRLTRPTFRLSQSIDDGSLSISGLTPTHAPGGGSVEAPRIDVIDGRVEFAEYSLRRGGFTVLNTLPMSGAFTSAAPGTGSAVYMVRLQETGRSAAAPADRRGLILDGRIDLERDEASLRLFNLSLDVWPPESVPLFMRDIWRRLNMQGRVSHANLVYSGVTGLDASITVENISMDALIPANNLNEPGAYLSLRQVEGEIALSASGLHADLNGLFEDQVAPSRVRLDTFGTDLNCPLRCEITGENLNVSENPAFLKYVPGTVRQYLEWFGGPTADVNARVVITRGDPVGGAAAPFEVPEGRLVFSNGRAAFHKFPYEFGNMSGEVDFDDKTIRILRIRGESASGARLSAAGVISPLTDDASVDLTIGVQGAPVDEAMLNAMRPGYRRLLEVLFSRERYRELLDRGLVRVADTGAQSPDQPRSFEFGGSADVGIKITRPYGPVEAWATEIEVEFARAGLVPEPFPLPIEAEDVRLHITDDRAEFTRGRFRGLNGGDAELEASVLFGRSEDDPMKPWVRIAATDVPVDALLLNAVPRGERADDESPPMLSANDILKNLNLEGKIDCSVAISSPVGTEAEPAIVGPIPIEGLDWSVVVELDKLTARPRPVKTSQESGAPGPVMVCVRELSGAVQVSPRAVHITSLVGDLGRVDPSHPDQPNDQTTPAGRIRLALTADLTAHERSTPASAAVDLATDIDLHGLNLADPIEQAIAVFNTDAARGLAEIRAKRDPRGEIDAAIHLERSTDGSHAVQVDFARAENVLVQAAGGTIGIDGLRGRVELQTAPSAAEGQAAGSAAADRLRFGGVHAGLSYGGASMGEIVLNGSVAISRQTMAPAPPASLQCGLRGSRFDSPALGELIQRFAGEDAGRRYAEVGPRGMFDADVLVSAPESDGEQPAGGISISGSLRPASFGFTLRGEPYWFESVRGEVTFEAPPPPPASPGAERSAHGSLRGIGLAGKGWCGSAEGSWQFEPDRGARINVRTSATSDGLSPSLLALLPASVRDGLADASLSAEGPVTLRDGRLIVDAALDAPGAEARAAFDGVVEFADVAAEAGMQVSQARGRATIRAGSAPDGVKAAADPAVATLASVAFELESAAVESVFLTDARATIDWSRRGDVIVHEATGRCHGGRLSASASLEVVGDGEPSRLRIDAMMSGVQFAPLLAELQSAGLPEPSGLVGPPRPMNGAGPDASRGTVDARLSLTSLRGDTDSRRGRGAIRISHGDVLRLPVVLPLVKVSNLMLPFGDRFDYLQSSFYIDGAAAVFDDVSLISDSVAIVGDGTVTWPDLALDMQFNSRARTRIPLFSDLFEALRNEIITTRITGTVAAPVVRSESLSGTRRMIDDVVRSAGPGAARVARPGNDPDDELAARRELERLRLSEAAIAPTPGSNQ